jgi:hypothetical protein
VDVIAIRKDHSEHGVRLAGMKRGNALQVVMIQVKGGAAAKPTTEMQGGSASLRSGIVPAQCFSERGRKLCLRLPGLNRL